MLGNLLFLFLFPPTKPAFWGLIPFDSICYRFTCCCLIPWPHLASSRYQVWRKGGSAQHLRMVSLSELQTLRLCVVLVEIKVSSFSRVFKLSPYLAAKYSVLSCCTVCRHVWLALWECGAWRGWWRKHFSFPPHLTIFGLPDVMKCQQVARHCSLQHDSVTKLTPSEIPAANK